MSANVRLTVTFSSCSPTAIGIAFASRAVANCMSRYGMLVLSLIDITWPSWAPAALA